MYDLPTPPDKRVTAVYDKPKGMTVWKVFLKTIMVFGFVILCLFLSSCARNCNTLEYLGNSLCR